MLCFDFYCQLSQRGRNLQVKGQKGNTHRIPLQLKLKDWEGVHEGEFRWRHWPCVIPRAIPTSLTLGIPTKSKQSNSRKNGKKENPVLFYVIIAMHTTCMHLDGKVVFIVWILLCNVSQFSVSVSLQDVTVKSENNCSGIWWRWLTMTWKHLPTGFNSVRFEVLEGAALVGQIGTVF